MIGSAMVLYQAAQGHAVVCRVSRAPGSGEARWDLDAGALDTVGLEGFDGMLHLANAPRGGRWNTGLRRHIRENRLLAGTLAPC